MSVTEAAAGLSVTGETLSLLVNGHAGISPEMAARLFKAFGRTPEAWLQMQYHLVQVWHKLDGLSLYWSEDIPMYCAKCGSQLVPSANYCHVCGTKIGSAQTPNPEPVNPTYEVCTISFVLIKVAGLFSFTHTWQLLAEANDPKGKYNASVSQEFKAGARTDDLLDGPDLHYGEAKQALEQLVARLLSDGWEPVASSALRPKFRRRTN